MHIMDKYEKKNEYVLKGVRYSKQMKRQHKIKEQLKSNEKQSSWKKISKTKYCKLINVTNNLFVQICRTNRNVSESKNNIQNNKNKNIHLTRK